MDEEEEDTNLKVQVVALKYEITGLKTEFKYFRNIMVTIYLTIVAPLLVGMFMTFMGKLK